MVTILAFLFVFSIVVVVHELGHFLAARACGVRVETFSIGFGPTLFAIEENRALAALGFAGGAGVRTAEAAKERASTVWRIAAIPLGGYVKFFGDASAASNPDLDRLTELRARIESEHGPEAVASCYHFKPVWQRAIVAAAGPVANFVLALAIFITATAIMGDRGFPAVVGAVAPDSPAQAAGLQKGDLITAINGRSVRYYRDVQQFAVLAGGDDAVITVARDGRTRDLPITVGRSVRLDAFGGEASVGFIGITLGLRPVLLDPVEGSPAEAAGFARGDVIVAVNGDPVDYFVEVQEHVTDAGAGPLRFTVERGGERIDLVPVVEMRVSGEGEDAESYPFVGLRRDVSDARIVERFGPIGSVARGATWTWESLAGTVRYVARTLTGRESGRELGGVLRIGKIAGDVAKQGFDSGADRGGPVSGLANALVALVLLAGALSVAIGLVNLLPIPILDGGHLVYYAYEAVAGRPLGEGAQEWGFRIGLALVLGLMIFATWNDLRYLRVFEAIGNVFS